jgi:hypothetical protein
MGWLSFGRSRLKVTVQRFGNEEGELQRGPSIER